MTTVLIAPARGTVILAKQTATVDRLSSGRLTLGIGVGGRKDDLDVVGESFATRGKRVDEQLALMKKVWSGARLSGRVGPVGPKPASPGGPEILIGGYNEKVVTSRVVKWGDGFISGGVPAGMAAPIFKSVVDAWKKSGTRSSSPRLVCSAYYALGNNAGERGAPYLRDYYGYMGDGSEYAVKGMLAGAEQVKQGIDSFYAIGADKVMLWPTIPEMSQLELLSSIVHRK